MLPLPRDLTCNSTSGSATRVIDHSNATKEIGQADSPMAVEGKRSFWLSAKDEANMARDSPAKVHPNVQLGLLLMVVVEMFLVVLIEFFLVTPCDIVATAHTVPP